MDELMRQVKCGRARGRSGGLVGALVALVTLASWVMAPGAEAEPQRVLRIASVAPEGSSWARTFQIFTRHVERGTKGEVAVKLYLGGVAGDERELQQRAAKGQLDGVFSGGVTCMDAMPSMRVTRIPGVFQSRDEASYVISELGATLTEEARRSSYVLLGTAGVGSSVIFSREPLHTMADVRKARFWRWQHDEVAVAAGRAMGLSIVPMAMRDGAKAFDEGRVDGFYAVPTAALVYQWHTQARYIVDLPGDYLVGCFLLTTDAYDSLTAAQQRVLREAGVKVALRFEESARRQDAALLGRIFAKHGVQHLPASVLLRGEFFQAARQARQKLGDDLLPTATLNRVLRLLADFRAEHGGAP